jgi:hypothetical protein
MPRLGVVRDPRHVPKRYIIIRKNLQSLFFDKSAHSANFLGLSQGIEGFQENF